MSGIQQRRRSSSIAEEEDDDNAEETVDYDEDYEEKKELLDGMSMIAMESKICF